MSRTRTAPQDYRRHLHRSETERIIDNLPARWNLRWQEIYFATPRTLTQAQALLQVQSEMDMRIEFDDECRCCLPEQTCGACVTPNQSDVELPY